MSSRLLKLDNSAAVNHCGHCFVVKLPAEVGTSDWQQDHSGSRLRLFENGRELGPAHCLHVEIARAGAGRFSQSQEFLYFSTGDGSSPISNGYDYSIVFECEEDEPDRSFPSSSLPFDILLRLQRGIMNYTYKGIDCFKCPFDLALYQRLVWNLKPRTIVEIGTLKGGSALWFADLLSTYGIEGHVHSLDIAEPPAWRDPRITFHRGDVMEIASVFPIVWAEKLARPLLVVEDSGHYCQTTTAVLCHFAPLMYSGEYIVVEDSIIHELRCNDLYDGGPRRALKEFLGSNDDFIIDRDYCDYFGKNVTWNVNGYLRRR